MPQIIALYGGGFKPPHLGHFEVVKTILEQNSNIDKFIIFVGSQERDKITQEHSIKIWEIYKKYLSPKIEIKASQAPIKDILKYSETNPNDTIYFVLGVREGNQNDELDIKNRTRSLNKYPNIEVKVIKTPKKETSGTDVRKNLNNKEELYKSIPEEISENDKEKIWNILPKQPLNELADYEIRYWALFYNVFKSIKPSPDKNYKKLKNKLKGEPLRALEYFYHTYFKDNKSLLNENSTYPQDIDYKDHIKKLSKEYLKKYPQVKQLPKVKFIHGDQENAKTLLTKTGYYDPNTKTIVVYTEGRHPRDIISSFSHEFYHFIQDMENKLDNIGTDNTLEDDNLDLIEREAYEEGNIMFRNYKDKLKKDPFGLNQFARELAQGLEENLINEGMYDSIVNQISNDTLKYWKSNFEQHKNKSTFLETYSFKDKKGRPLDFDYEAIILFKKTPEGNYIVDGGANATFTEDEGFIKVKFQVDPRDLPKMWSNISLDLKDVIRHEIEHLFQEGFNLRSQKPPSQEGNLTRYSIQTGLTPEKFYYLLPDEIEPMLRGLYLKAKKSKRPFSKVVDEYLNLVGLTPEEKEEILKVWEPATKKYSLPSLLESEQKYKIYCDLDETLVGFDSRFQNIKGSENLLPREYEKKYGTEKFWELIENEGIRFWIGMKWLPDGKQLWNYIKPYNPILLSAPSQHPDSSLGKRIWVKQNLPGQKILLTPARQKKKYASPNSILIDDFYRNIDEWEEEGGIGILHTSAEDTIQKLKILGL